MNPFLVRLMQRRQQADPIRPDGRSAQWPLWPILAAVIVLILVIAIVAVLQATGRHPVQQAPPRAKRQMQ
jgi:hypothetical protein